MGKIVLNEKIELVSVNDIHSSNDSHDASSVVELLKESISKYGLQQPIVIDNNNNIASGNGIFNALTELGYKEVPCIRLEYLTEEQVKQYRIADNKTSEFARWNQQKLEKELSYLGKPDELQFCFDDDLNKILTKDAVQFTHASPVNVIQQQNHAVANNNVEPIRKTGLSESFNREQESFNAKNVEYFEYKCSACGRTVTVKI